MCGPRILIVDDVFFNVDILRDVLQKVHKINISLDLVEAYNGKQALQMYKKLSGKFEGENPIRLILMDCDMPVMNGFEATKKILAHQTKINKEKGINAALPVIVALTGDTTEKYQKLAQECGMKTMMSKPLNSNDLKKLLVENGIY
jgi:CheY-like chemotaxis protein